MRVNLFLVYSPLHYVAAERIAETFEAGARNFLYLLNRRCESLPDRSKWAAVRPLPWPRFHPLPGLFGKARRTVENLRTLERDCEGATEILLHTPVIDTEAVNYAINHLRRSFPAARFAVRLTPDGVMNVQRYPLGRVKELSQYFRKFRRVLFPTLDYYTFRGDRTGSDDPVVERIYTLPRFPHRYDPAKVVEIPSLCGADAEHDAAAPERRWALVLGQPLVAFRCVSAQDERELAAGMREWLRRQGFERILYKAHPRDANREFDHPDYEDLSISEPLEMHFARHPYGLVVSVASTGLLTARLILPPECRVATYGFERVWERDRVYDPYVKLGVEIVRHDPA